MASKYLADCKRIKHELFNFELIVGKNKELMRVTFFKKQVLSIISIITRIFINNVINNIK